MQSPEGTATIDTNTAPSVERVPVFLLLMSVLSIALLALTTIWGAFATNRRVSAPYRAALMHESIIAEEASLDLAAMRRGRAEYMKTCTACHGPNGEAKPNLGKDLRILLETVRVVFDREKAR